MFDKAEFYVSRRVQIKNSGVPKQHKIAAFLDEDTVILSDPTNSMMTHAGIKLARLEPLPEKTSDAEKRGFLGGSDFLCTADEATEWFVFVMIQAGILYERIPSESWDEIKRLLTVRGVEVGSPWYVAAEAYYQAAEKWYEEDRKND